MSVMRDGWVETTFGEVVVLNPETAEGIADDDQIVYVDLSSVSAESGISSDLYRGSFGAAPGRARRVIRTQDVLVSTVRPYLRGFALVPEFLDGEIASTGFAVLRAKPSKILSGLVWAIVGTNNFVDYLMDRATGSSYPAVRPEDVSSFDFSLPSLDEQKRIVDVVSSVDAYIDALQEQAAVARTARNSVLHELLSTGGDDWTETTLGELCELYQPETISKAQMDDAAPYIVYGANGPVGRYSRFNHEEPEVVVTCRGATCGVVNMTPPNCWITGNAMVVKPRDNRATKGFLFWALQTSVDVQATVSGSAQPQITRTGLEPSRILVPPLVEQKRIVEIVSSMDVLIQSTEEAVMNAKNLRSGLLSDLLSGDHEIPASYDSLLGAA